jgi:hypothetical protein
MGQVLKPLSPGDFDVVAVETATHKALDSKRVRRKQKKWRAMGCRPLLYNSGSVHSAGSNADPYAVNELPQPQLRAALGF